jgi:hypothetical protein
VDFENGRLPDDAPQLDVGPLYEAVEQLRQNSSKAFMLCEVVDLRAGCGLETTVEDGDEPPANHQPT